jgi:predicted kinase
MKKLVICQGLPASGKSTYAKELVSKEKFKRINRDELRAMLDCSVWSKANEKIVSDARDQILKNSLENGFNVVVDDTNLVESTVKHLVEIAREVGDVEVITEPFNTSIEECLARNSKREGIARVPDSVIIGMSKLIKGKLLSRTSVKLPARFKTSSVTTQNESLPKAIICDLDGTLALIGDRSPYDASQCDVKDKPNTSVIECVIAMYLSGYKIIYMSGRDEKYREQSVRFIEKYVTYWNDVSTFENHGTHADKSDFVKVPYELFMRSLNDKRKDSVVKRELFETHVAGKYNIQFVLDDRNQVVEVWRQMGLTCFQVAEGNF